MALAKEIPFERQNAAPLPGILTLQDLPGIYREFCRDLPPEAIQRTKGKETRKGYDTDGYGYQWCMDLLNEVVGLGHWRIITREAFSEEGEYSSGRKAYETGFDVTVQIGNWTPAGFEVLAETPCTPGGHVSATKSDARKGALTNAIKKALAFFGIGSAAYRGELDDDNLPPEGRTYQSARGTGRTPGNGGESGSGSGNRHGGGNGAGGGTGNGKGNTTGRLIETIKEKLDRAALDAGYPSLTHKNQGFLTAVLTAAGFKVTSLEQLTKAQANQLIDKMPDLVKQAIQKAQAAKNEKQASLVSQQKPGETTKPDLPDGQPGIQTTPGSQSTQQTIKGSQSGRQEQPGTPGSQDGTQKQPTTPSTNANGRRRLF